MGLSSGKPDHAGHGMGKVADMIEDKRRRTYADAEAEEANAYQPA